MKRCLLNDISILWEEIISQEIKEWRNRSLRASAIRLAWGAADYHIWRQRNDLKHGNQGRSEEKMLQI
jgi:hypothetical protein